MSQNNRKYTITDARLLEHGSVLVKSLEDDLDDFSSFDSTISRNFTDRVQEAIDASYQIKSDRIVIYELAQLTNELNRHMAACKNAYETVAYFAQKVFRDNISVQSQFGLNDSRPGNNHLEMIIFMASLAKTAAIYRDSLEKGGINPDVIDTLPKLQEELYEAKNRQEMFKKERSKTTYERVKRMNALYDRVNAISDIARIIYEENPANLNKYLIPIRRPSKRSSDEKAAS